MPVYVAIPLGLLAGLGYYCTLAVIAPIEPGVKDLAEQGVNALAASLIFALFMVVVLVG